jgi:hypothetical protein
MIFHIHQTRYYYVMWGRSSGGTTISRSSFLAIFFVVTITFCLVSAGIFKTNTSISMAAYATKSEGSSGGDKSDDRGGSKGSGDTSSGGSDGGGSSGEGGGGSSGVVMIMVAVAVQVEIMI